MDEYRLEVENVKQLLSYTILVDGKGNRLQNKPRHEWKANFLRRFLFTDKACLARFE